MFKIFPATITHDGKKLPLLQNWQNIATSDQAAIKVWQEQFRDRFSHYGVPTGLANDILVLDVDVKVDPRTGKNGFDSLKELNLPQTFYQNTLSGGLHLFFKYPKDGKHYGQRVKFMSGLDTRGEGGYIIWYGTDCQIPIADAPQEFLELILRQKPSTENKSPVKVAPEIAKGIFESALLAIENAVSGERNNTLNVQGYIVGQLVGAGSITREHAEEKLSEAALKIGLDKYETKTTVKSAIDGGIKNPLTSPFDNSAPVSVIDIPPPPVNSLERWTPKYFTKDDLLNTKALKKPQLFEHWSSEDITITTADGGTGKSTMTLQEAICLALGEPFLGFMPKQTGKTLFITGEDTDKKLGAILGMMLRQMGLFDEQIGNEAKVQQVLQSIVVKKDPDLCLITKDRQGFLVPNMDALNKVLQAVQDLKPKMIVFDPIASFWGSENALNDMNRAVIKIMSELVDKSQAAVVMINHMGKSSSNQKDMSQFAGRGGTGLPSNSRISRTLRGVDRQEYEELTGKQLGENKTAILCNVNKFTDGSPLYNKPFLIIRNGYLFTREELSPQKADEVSDSSEDNARIFNFILEERRAGKYPTKAIIEQQFMYSNEPISVARVGRSIQWLAYNGFDSKKVELIDNPNINMKDKALTILDNQGKEIT